MNKTVILAATAMMSLLPLAHSGTEDQLPQTAAPNTGGDNGVPIAQLVRAVAHKTGRRYLLDSRVTGSVHLIGQDPASVTGPELASLLSVVGAVAVDNGGYVRVLPDSNMRMQAVPLLHGHESYPDAQPVSAVIEVHNGPAAQLVPILRPLIPQMGQLAAWPCANALLMVDTYANVRRIEALVRALEASGTPYKVERCESHGGP